MHTCDSGAVPVEKFYSETPFFLAIALVRLLHFDSSLSYCFPLNPKLWNCSRSCCEPCHHQYENSILKVSNFEKHHRQTSSLIDLSNGY